MIDLVLLQQKNDQRWKVAKITGRLPLAATANKAFANKSIYLDIIKELRSLGSNIPDVAWVFIAVIHNRESGMNFNTHLGQGDPLTDKNGRPIKTVHVPAGRGPFTGSNRFVKAGVDALWYCAPYAAKNNKDWSISGMLTYLERYNGLAYANANRPSPYLWSGTTIYDPPTGPGGKVIVDHGPITNTVDKQLGVAALLLKLDELDSTIDFGDITITNSSSIVPDISPVTGVLDAVWLQDTLNRLGATPQLVVDGIIGNGTKTAIKAFQKSHGLKVDGIVGTASLSIIKAELKKVKLPLFPEGATT